ncbi:hypothetical protein BGW80DRAFT_835695 [Lactifluus volemus]|nr:hypothetical protein BGW80DRAFT_835695 [Lactifluus volemus]
MGSVSSKGARTSSRKFDKVPSWTGARTQPHNPKASPLPTARQPWASETKDEAIQRDAKDPEFMANLNRLGPVRVDHHMQTIKTQGSLVKELFESRSRAEEEESNDRGSLRNRLHVSSLVRLLEERRDLDLADGGGGPAAAGSQSVSVNVRKASSLLLAEKYGMDVEKVERLVRFVNVPSVREGEKGVRRRYVGDAESGEEVAITEGTKLSFCSSPPKRSELMPFVFILVVLGRVEGTNEYCAARIKKQ